jgi:hypothetical protein
MTRASRERFQVNVPLEDEHWHLVLLQLAIREGRSVPELLRPVVVAYLKRQLRRDAKLAAAVANMEESRSGARDQRRRRRDLAEVMPMAATSQRPRPTNQARPRKAIGPGSTTRSPNQ